MYLMSSFNNDLLLTCLVSPKPSSFPLFPISCWIKSQILFHLIYKDYSVKLLSFFKKQPQYHHTYKFNYSLSSNVQSLFKFPAVYYYVWSKDPNKIHTLRFIDLTHKFFNLKSFFHLFSPLKLIYPKNWSFDL